MPNHVQNILTIVGHKNHVEPMMKSLKDDEQDFSFSKIVPMPEELKGTRAPAKILTPAQYKKQEYDKNFSAEPHPLMSNDKGGMTQKMSDDLIEKFGFNNWYDWSCVNWGTKWGCYSVSINETESLGDGNVSITVYFQTAWSSGESALSKLAEVYPTIEFHLKYADEDCGSNTGDIWWKEGFRDNEDIPEHSMENYFFCWGGEEDWVCVDGEWNWKDDDE